MRSSSFLRGSACVAALLAVSACDRLTGGDEPESAVKEQGVQAEQAALNVKPGVDPEQATRDEFGRGLAARIERTAPEYSAVYDAERFELVVTAKDGRESRASLTNIYGEYMQAEVGHKRELLDRYVKISTMSEEPRPTLAEARSMLIPMVRDEIYFVLGHENSTITAQERVKGVGIGGALTAHACFDYPDRISCVESRKSLEEIGLDPDEVMKIAKDNLRERSGGEWEQPAAGINTYVSPWGDNHDASRLLLTEMIRGLDVKGEPVVMVPNRDNLVVTGSRDPEGIAQMAAVAKSIFEGPRPLSGLAYRLTARGYERWLPSKTDPSYEALHSMAVLDRAEVYNADKDRLDARHEKEQVDIFVASVLIVDQGEAKNATSVATWTQGVDTLLPEAEHIALVNIDEDEQGSLIAMVPWAQAEPIVGKYMEPLEGYPRRYRVKKFPTKSELARLKRLDARI